MIFVRSLLFNAFFYLNTIFWLIVMLPTELMPKAALKRCIKLWAKANRWAFTAIGGVKVELRGLENIPKTGAIIASKHQSTFETATMLDLFVDPIYVLKKELLRIPLFGWYAVKAEQIPVDRSAGRAALAQMTERARREVARGRQLIIYPEGTRRPAGAEKAYKHGVAHMYGVIGAPIVPVALNSGLFWARHGFMRWPGTLVVSFLPPIPAGRDPEAVFAELQEKIETATDDLIAEALSAPNPPPIPEGGEAFLKRRPIRI
ncbi:MAG: lysophospholipid acyltransferase family protein [Siculibacillus sp.]